MKLINTFPFIYGLRMWLCNVSSLEKLFFVERTWTLWSLLLGLGVMAHRCFFLIFVHFVSLCAGPTRIWKYRPLIMFVNQDKSSLCLRFYCLAANFKETISVGKNAHVHLRLWSDAWCGCAEIAFAWGIVGAPAAGPLQPAALRHGARTCWGLQPHLVWLASCVGGGVKKLRKLPC